MKVALMCAWLEVLTKEEAYQQSSHLSAVQELLMLVFATACVEALARGHEFGGYVLQERLWLAVFDQQQLEQRLGLAAVMFELTSLPL